MVWRVRRRGGDFAGRPMESERGGLDAVLVALGVSEHRRRRCAQEKEEEEEGGEDVGVCE